MNSLDAPSRERRRLAIGSPYLYRLQLRHFLLFNLFPTLGSVAAIAWVWLHPITKLDLSLFFALWLLTGLGISAGYHRLLCHRTYSAAPSIRALLTILGCMAAQGPPVSWVAMHRRHHQIADEEGDVHSPNLHGTGLRSRVRGFIHSHFTWMVRHEYPNVIHYVPDLLNDPLVTRLSRHYTLWIVLGLVAPAIIAFAFTGQWIDAVSGFVWGGILRLFIVSNSISALNSVLHLIGTQRFKARGSRDNSRNNMFLGLLVWGEGWHNNHHAFPYSASFALSWYKVDFSYWFIRALEQLNLTWDVTVPSLEQISSRAPLSIQGLQEKRLSSNLMRGGSASGSQGADEDCLISPAPRSHQNAPCPTSEYPPNG